MGLDAKFTRGFRALAAELGLPLEEAHGETVIRDDRRYLSLRVFDDTYGLARVTFARVRVIVGNVEAARRAGVLDEAAPEAGSGTEKVDSAFSWHPPGGAGVSDRAWSDESVPALSDWHALRCRFCRGDDFTFVEQQGTHDWVLKDPVLIRCLLGTKPVAEALDEIARLDLPPGWLVQKPRGLGDKNTAAIWKAVGVMAFALLGLLWLIRFLSRMS